MAQVREQTEYALVLLRRSSGLVTCLAEILDD